jgi:hypothetical protein
MPVFRGELASRHPVFPKGSIAAVAEHGTPVALDAPDITYTTKDDEAIEAYVRKFGAQCFCFCLCISVESSARRGSVSTCWHSVSKSWLRGKYSVTRFAAWYLFDEVTNGRRRRRLPTECLRRQGLESRWYVDSHYIFFVNTA